MFPHDVATSRPNVIRCAVVIGAVSAAIPLLAATVLGPPPRAVLSREKLSPIDDFINGEIASGKIPGAIVLIRRHGQQVYFKCFGKRDVERGTPMTADAIFPIHSVTKTITSVAAMMLVDRGKISPDDPVSKYIPSIAGMKVGVKRKLAKVPLTEQPRTLRDYGHSINVVVVDRAQDLSFVLRENSPSGRMHVQTTLKRISYDAFGKIT
jgi:CubicO group peptidase (beta-lactamase class C family)